MNEENKKNNSHDGLSDKEDTSQELDADLADDDISLRRSQVEKNLTEAQRENSRIVKKKQDKARQIDPAIRAARDAEREKIRKEQKNNTEFKENWTWRRIEKEIWATAFNDKYPNLPRLSWSKGKEGVLAEKILVAYKGNIKLVSAAVQKLFDNWIVLRSKTFPYSKDPNIWVTPDFYFFNTREGQQFLMTVTVNTEPTPKIPDRTKPEEKLAVKKSPIFKL